MLKRNSDGVSLLEVCIAMTILALAMATGYPSFSAWVTNLKIRTAGEKAVTAIHLARTEALRRNTRMTAYLMTSLDNSCAVSGAGRNIIVSVSDPTGSCSAAASDTTGAQIAMKESLANTNKIAVATSGGNNPAGAITFDGLGRVVTASSWFAQMDITSSPAANYRSMRVQVSPGGLARLCDPAVSSQTDTRRCN